MATITSLAAGDNGSDSRTTINTNFTNLNTDKIEADSTDTLTNKTFDANGTGNSITNINTADIVDATATPTASKIVVADGSAKVDGWISAADLTTPGIVELATAAETDTGTDATRAITPDGFQASKRNIRWLAFPIVAGTTDCATGTNLFGDFVSPIAGVIQQSDTTPFYLYATNSTAGTTGNMVVDINIGGTSIMTTNKLSFDSTEKTTTTSATPPDLTTTALAVGDIITIDVDSVHTTPAKGLIVYMAVLET